MPSGLRCTYRWRINNCNSLHDLLLVRLRARAVEVTDDRGHAGLVAEGGRQVDLVLLVVLGEAVEEGGCQLPIPQSHPIVPRSQ